MRGWMGIGAVTVVLGIVLGATLASGALDTGRRTLMATFRTAPAPPPPTVRDLTATFDGPDALRERLPVALVPVASGFIQPTDIQFVPGHPTTAAVLEKSGHAWLVDVTTGERRPWFEVPVAALSEMGLLGLAFAPDFATSGRFVVHHNPPDGRSSEITAWRCVDELDDPRRQGLVLRVDQPYPNTNGGQMAFGPDDALYVGLGDGGFRGDPHGHGQDGTTLLGSILRIQPGPEGGYAVPAENPFRNDPKVRDEIFALGLHDPWRLTFDSYGRLVVADAGQDRFEEIDIVAPGSNQGWNVREGWHCLDGRSQCGDASLSDPVWEYGRQEGSRTAGGVVYTGSALPSLRDRYIFSDLVSGRLWALELPLDGVGPATPPISLGHWPVLTSALARDASGEVYLLDLQRGALFRVQPAAPPAEAAPS